MTTSDIADVIRETLRRKGTNPSRFAKENGFSVNAVRYILTEGRAPNSRQLAKICAALDLEFYVGPSRLPARNQLSASKLAEELENLASAARRLSTTKTTSGLVLAPRYSVQASAGGGSMVDEEAISGYLGFSKQWLKNKGLIEDMLAVIEVYGDSMEPTLYAGDVVLLDLSEQPLRSNEIYTLRQDDVLIIKRLQRQDDQWMITSDNILYPVESLNEEYTVVGRAAWVSRTLK